MAFSGRGTKGYTVLSAICFCLFAAECSSCYWRTLVDYEYQFKVIFVMF